MSNNLTNFSMEYPRTPQSMRDLRSKVESEINRVGDSESEYLNSLSAMVEDTIRWEKEYAINNVVEV